MRRLIALGLVAMSAMSFAPSEGATEPCTPRVLVLSAMPGEIDGLLTNTTVTGTESEDGRTFYVGTLRGNDVVLALTGIGLVNAEQTTRAAFEHFDCGISGVVFSGVSGGSSDIGDVTIPGRWTADEGATWFDVDGGMYATALSIKDAAAGQLASATPTGDLACVGLDPDLITTVEIERPEIIAGGSGGSSDPFGGRRLPCIPGGGDVFGCRPCSAPGASADEAQAFATDAPPFFDPDFFSDYNDWQSTASSGYDAVDMETGAAARVAAEHATPFIAFRALSDGQGDPLQLPGFPFQFFYYRQLAADNAATVALAFLEAWSAA